MTTRRTLFRLLPFLGALPLIGKLKPLPEGHEILKSFDARDWAKDFVACVRSKPTIATDEGTMVGWFANALMRGYDQRENEFRTVDLANHRSIAQLEKIIAELERRNDFLVEKSGQLAVQNEQLRDYRDRMERGVRDNREMAKA